MGHVEPANTVLLLGSLFLIISVFASKLSSRLGVPALVLFVGIGMLAGSEGPGRIPFEDFALTKQIGMILLAYILFAGGLDTSWKHLRPVVWRGLALSTIGVICTTALVGAFAHYVLGLRLIDGLLLGAIVASTDSAAIFSSLRGGGMSLKPGLAPLLEVESGTNDPLAVFLTASLTEFAVHPETPLLKLIPALLTQMPIGVAVGFVVGKGTVWLLNHIRLEYDGLYSVITLASVGITYGAAALAGGNAFIAVYAVGVTMGSHVFRHKTSLSEFHDGIAWLLQIVVFLSLGLLVFPSQILPTIGAGIVFAAFLLLIARPAAVFLSLALARMEVKPKMFVAWAGLRGAFPIILGTFPVLAGLQSGHLIFNLVFFVVLVSVLIQGSTLRKAATLLGVTAESSPSSSIGPHATELLKVELGDDSPANGKQVIELGLPSTAFLVSLTRGPESLTPCGSTVLASGDTILVASRRDDYEELRLLLSG